MGAAPAFPGGPALPPVELGHQQQPPALRCVEMGGELGDLALQALERKGLETLHYRNLFGYIADLVHGAFPPLPVLDGANTTTGM